MTALPQKRPFSVLRLGCRYLAIRWLIDCIDNAASRFLVSAFDVETDFRGIDAE